MRAYARRCVPGWAGRLSLSHAEAQRRTLDARRPTYPDARRCGSPADPEKCLRVPHSQLLFAAHSFARSALFHDAPSLRLMFPFSYPDHILIHCMPS